MGKVLRFEVTDWILQQRIRRACTEAEKTVMERAAWLYKMTWGFEDRPPPFMTEEERQAFDDGSYEL